LTHSHLITRNVRDFQDIDGLSLMALYLVETWS
jgi:predicted nucleic acid-binding protein